MSYVIVITREAPHFPAECVIETVTCTSKQDLDAKYIALTKRIGRDIISIRIEHSDGCRVGKRG